MNVLDLNRLATQVQVLLDFHKCSVVVHDRDLPDHTETSLIALPIRCRAHRAAEGLTLSDRP